MLKINDLLNDEKPEKNIVVFYNESGRSRKEKHVIINFYKWTENVFDASINNTRIYLDKTELNNIIESINNEIKRLGIDRSWDYFYNIVFWDLIRKAGIKVSSITRKYELIKII